VLVLIRPRRCRDEDGLGHHPLELGEC
jgi:hypothetical protein